jgi:hypothetical protein
MIRIEFRRNVGIPLDMANNPEVPHRVPWGGDLRMVLIVRNEERVPIVQLIRLRPQRRHAEALRREEPIVVNFRLRMMVRGVARPAARQVDVFAKDEVGPGGIVLVEYGADNACARSLHRAFIAILDLALIWKVEPGREACPVDRGGDIEQGPFRECLDRDICSRGQVQNGGVLF